MEAYKLDIINPNKYNELQGYYLQDTWNLYEHSKFLNQSNDEREKFIKSGKVHRIHFEWCNNIKLRNDLKYWMYYLIEVVDKKISSLPSDITLLHRFIKFVNINIEDLNSLMDIELGEIYNQYDEFLKTNGYLEEYNSASIITEDMEKRTYKYENGALTALKRMYKAVDDYFDINERKISEYDKDKWDIRNLPFHVELPPSRPRYTISFNKIHQPILKKYAKKYLYIRLKSKSYNTCVDDLKGINEFSLFLKDYHPEIEHLSDLNRELTEKYISHINTLAKLGITSKRSRLGTLRTFLETCRFNEWDNIAPDVLLYDDDLKFKVKTLPKYYTDNEIKMINKYILDLPKQIAWMLFVIESVGMRVSELCSLEKHNLILNPNGTYTLKYRQPKSNT